MYGLALHTTTSQLGLCLSNFSGETRSQVWQLGRDLSSYLHQYLLEFISPQTWQNLDFIAVANGPGSFTSTRMGVVTARTLAQQLNIPLFAVSSLAAFAWSVKDNYSINSLIPLQMEATRGQLYVAIYQIAVDSKMVTPLLADTLMTPQMWQEKLEELAIAVEPLSTPTELGTNAKSVLELAYYSWQQGKRPHWSEVLPFYGMSAA